LRPYDAEILVRLRGKDVMWQKERLLNVALRHLPDECEHVAWLDCDMVFESQNWAAATVEVLREYPLCQPFRALHHLNPDVPIRKEFTYRSNRSLGYGLSEGLKPRVESSGDSSGLKRGNAWAATRELLERTGFYDCGILGGGDGFMSFAALGRQEEVIRNNNCSPAHAEQYRAWAWRFYDEVRGRIGYTDTEVFHLWHGDLRDRRYDQRHCILRDFDFDPLADIALDEQGCWRWNSPKYGMHQSIREYFYERNEDGPLVSEAAV
jgi:hypothetical protein